MGTSFPLESESDTISRPPSTLDIYRDRAFRGLCFGFAWLTVLVVVLIVWEIGRKALPTLQSQGAEFLTTSKWDPGKAKFGIAAEIGGTLYSSFLAVVIATVLGVNVAILLTQEFLPPTLERLLKNTVELLAAIPSVVYGLWGIFVLIPVIRPPANWLHDHLGWIPFFSTHLMGPGMLPAALVLAIMVLPTIAGRRASQNPRGRFRSGRHQVGNDHRRHPAFRFARHLWSDYPGLGTRFRRDDGLGDAHRFLE
jgi:phosphate transport system permease protein